MATTPDPTETLTTLLIDANAKLDKLVAALSTTTPTPAPAPAPASAFAEKWKPVTPDEFRERFGVEYGQPIPPMTAYDEELFTFYARSYYNPATGKPGLHFTRAAEVQDAIQKIANATEATYRSLYEQGAGVDPDVAAAGFYTGTFLFQSEYQSSFGAGVSPKRFAGYNLEKFWDHEFNTARGGGQPSGG
jgi:hypothetical protein